MRARIVMELCLHEEFYLSDHNAAKTWASFSEYYTTETLTSERVRQLFRKEVQAATALGSYLGVWPFQAVASVLQVPLMSVYPEYGGKTVCQDLHRQFQPRVSAATTVRQNPSIMWSRLQGKDRPASGWLPNHFVVCLPDETQGTPRKRPAGTDIRSFFNKFPKSDN